MLLRMPRRGWWMTEKIRLAANTFWGLAGYREPFPRSLLEPVAWGLPAGVLFIPGLWLADVRAWATRNGAEIGGFSQDRRLRGCLIAAKGKGMVIIDGRDDPADRTFTLAHEAAHFLLEHHLPRLRLINLLGTSITEVLDGLREPTIEERFAGVLFAESLFPGLHCMDRDDSGLYINERTRQAESDADLLALELLAPEAAVRGAARGSRGVTGGDVAKLLQQSFGLPDTIAAVYASELVSRWSGERSFRSWLTGSEDVVEL